MFRIHSSAFILLTSLLMTALPAASMAEERISLSPRAVQKMVLERSFGVKQAEMTRQAASEAIPEAKGTFDTLFSGTASYQLNKEKQINPIFGSRTDSVDWGVGLSKELSPTGTTLGLSLNSDWTKTQGSLAIAGNPIIPDYGLYEPILGFSLSQPLMKNAFGMLDRGAVKEAKHAYASADSSVRREIDRLLYEALGHYWTVSFTRRQLSAIERSIRFARVFLKTTEEERKLGTADETDLLAAQANLKSRENEYKAYEELERAAEEKLKTALELDPDDLLVVSEQLPEKTRDVGNVDDLIALAFTQRGDYIAAKAEVERQRVRLAMAKNRRWPELDLVSTLNLNEIDRSYADALGGMDSPNLTVGLAMSIPLENRSARAGARRVQAEKARALFELKDLENSIANEIAHLAETVRTRLAIVESTRSTLDLHLKKQELEMEKYQQGRSSSDLVIRYQDDSVLSQRSLFEAWLAYQKAMLDLRLAKGAMVEEP